MIKSGLVKNSTVNNSPTTTGNDLHRVLCFRESKILGLYVFKRALTVLLTAKCRFVLSEQVDEKKGGNCICTTREFVC